MFSSGWKMNKKILHSLVTLFILWPCLALANTGHLTAINVAADDQVAHIKLSLSQSTPYRVFRLKHPDRLVIDLSHTQLAMHLRDVDFSHAILMSVRSGHPNDKMLRVVFDLKAPVKFHVIGKTHEILVNVALINPPEKSGISWFFAKLFGFGGGAASVAQNTGKQVVKSDVAKGTSLHESESSAVTTKKIAPNKLVATKSNTAPSLTSMDQSTTQTVSESKSPSISKPIVKSKLNVIEKPMSQPGAQPIAPSITQSAPTRTEISTPAPLPAIKNLGSHEFIVVIDPGHGGKDPGAKGEKGTDEKTVVLAIAKQLSTLINHKPHMHAVLTRNGDYFVTLRERLKLARKGKADLFIAIHADSYLNDKSTGASVYALSQRGATSEAARWLAKSENYSELGGVDLGELSDQSVVLRSVLIDLAQTATITDSLHLGQSILDSLNKVTELHYARVEQAPFVVLKSPDIPSILVEIGFISNPSEEIRLREKVYQAKVAQALFNGIQIYIKKYSVTGV